MLLISYDFLYVLLISLYECTTWRNLSYLACFLQLSSALLRVCIIRCQRLAWDGESDCVRKGFQQVTGQDRFGETGSVFIFSVNPSWYAYKAQFTLFDHPRNRLAQIFSFCHLCCKSYNFLLSPICACVHFVASFNPESCTVEAVVTTANVYFTGPKLWLEMKCDSARRMDDQLGMQMAWFGAWCWSKNNMTWGKRINLDTKHSLRFFKSFFLSALRNPFHLPLLSSVLFCWRQGHYTEWSI